MMKFLIGFIAGMMAGGVLGVVFMCLMITVGRADREMERYYDETPEK